MHVERLIETPHLSSTLYTLMSLFNALHTVQNSVLYFWSVQFFYNADVV